MNKAHRFSDEWIVKAFEGESAITPDRIEHYRKQSVSCLSEQLLLDNVYKEIEIGALVQRVFGLPFVSVDTQNIEKTFFKILPGAQCKRLSCVPLEISDETIKVAMANPLNVTSVDDVRLLSGRRVEVFFALPSQLRKAFHEIDDEETIAYDLLCKIGEAGDVVVLGSPDGKTSAANPKTEAVDKPVIRLVNSLIFKAVHMRASDIHIEQEERQTLVRFRIDGNLRNILSLPTSLGRGPMVSRIKIMANLDLADHMRPQDGRARLQLADREMGLRVSTLPTNYGEKVVMRLLDPKSSQANFEQLGVYKKISDLIEKILTHEQGMVLVTGPTGSGKTTTLYLLLNRIKSPDTNIVTVEDPIEYQLPGINQVQVNEKQGLTFAGVLRSVLRQDPDVILVGEIRDGETATIAFQAAMTGHLVFSTLHTNDTISSIGRLVDIGLDSYKITPSVLAIMAQRLVRKICPSCKVPDDAAKLPADVVVRLKKYGFPTLLHKGVGCPNCGFSGFFGRVPLIEYLEMTDALKTVLAHEKDETKIRQQAIGSGALLPMEENALAFLSNGTTTYEEIIPYLSQKTAADAEAPAASVKEPSAKKKIIIVDDDRGTRFIVKLLLEKQGYQVAEAENGLEGLELLSQEMPDLILLDVDMPQMNGPEMLATVREVMGNLDVPIIILTVRKESALKQKLLEKGANDFLNKPIDKELLLARIKAVMARAD